MEELQAAGLAVDRKNYELVYTAPLDGKTTLENIYRTLNTDDRPADFRGHSLSVSDVVVVNRGGKEEAHYCDSIGFTPVPEFMQESPIKIAEMSTEQNYNMIDGAPEQCPVDGGTGSQSKGRGTDFLFDGAEAAARRRHRSQSSPARRPRPPSARKSHPSGRSLKPPRRNRPKSRRSGKKSKELEV